MLNLLKAPHLSNRASLGLLFVRLMVGYAFAVHGWGKIQHPFSWMGPDATVPAFLQALAAVSEFCGGIAWMIGALTPIASFGLLCTMFEAARLHLFTMKDPLIAKGPGGSAEPAAVYFCIAAMLLLAGPGKFSVDAKLFGERSAG